MEESAVLNFLAKYWPFGAALIALGIRVEGTRMNHTTRLSALEARMREDREAVQRQRAEDIDRLEKRLSEISQDVKTLLRKGGD